MKQFTKIMMASVGVTFAAVSSASQLFATSYDTLNGNTGDFPYFDGNYTGSGNTHGANAPLTGGLGALTDGIVSTKSWPYVSNGQGTGLFVGWTLDNTITFHFAGNVNIDTVTVYADDSAGGGVSLPKDIMIDGVDHYVDTSFHLAGNVPQALTFSGLGLSGHSLSLTVVRSDVWAMVSEVTFKGNTGSAPAPACGIAVAVHAIGLIRRRVKKG